MIYNDCNILGCDAASQNEREKIDRNTFFSKHNTTYLSQECFDQLLH